MSENLSATESSQIAETTKPSEEKKRRTYKMSEEDRAKRKERGKQLALKKAEKIKENMEKKNEQVTYKNYFGIINDLVESESDKSHDEEIDAEEKKPVIKTKSKQKEEKVVIKPEKVKVTENITIVNPIETKKEEPKKKTMKELMRESLIGATF